MPAHYIVREFFSLVYIFFFIYHGGTKIIVKFNGFNDFNKRKDVLGNQKIKNYNIFYKIHSLLVRRNINAITMAITALFEFKRVSISLK